MRLAEPSRSTGLQKACSAVAVWSSGGKDYDRVSHGIADALEQCVRRLYPQPSERVLDLATGSGWTSRIVVRRLRELLGQHFDLKFETGATVLHESSTELGIAVPRTYLVTIGTRR